MDQLSLLAEHCATSGHAFASQDAEFLGQGIDQTFRETLEAWDTTTISRETPETGQRAAVGVLFDDLEASGDNEEPSERIEKLKSNSFREFRVPPVHEAVYAQFPHVSFLSIPLGAWRVLPAVRKYAQDLGRDVSVMFEVYDDQTIHYIGLLEPDVEPYLVEEFREEEPVPAEEERKEESEDESEDKTDPVDAAFEKVGHADLGDFETLGAEVEVIQPKDQLAD
nr:unnamed protein product [Spirometra erinaceieuropaei]